MVTVIWKTMRGLQLRSAGGATKSILTAALGALFGFGVVLNRISTHAAKAYYNLKQLKGIKLTKRKNFLKCPMTELLRSTFLKNETRLTFPDKEECDG